GRAHKKIRTAAGLVPYGGEQDNLDQAGRGSVISIEALSRLEPDALCNRCFAASEPEDAA
ncbi:MAG TPA: hypothetical protein VFI15_09110, partial [Candidatus Limnocylindrales bacterium]|nr:hypothetical protein [Candidatus Limnocylindrales bacterium]